MTKRSPASVVILTLVTLGIYGLVWMIKTKNEMVKCGADIPTGWLLIVPIAQIYWFWKFAGGVYCMKFRPWKSCAPTSSSPAGLNHSSG